MKVSRKQLLELCEEFDIATSKKNKPFSNDALLEAVKENIDDMLDEDGNTDNTVVAALSVAFDEEDDVEVTGDDPTVPKKAVKPEKVEKPAKGKKAKKDEAEDEDEEEETKPAKSKKGKKPAAKEEDADEEDEKTAKDKKKDKPKKKKESNRDKWGSNPESSAGQINAVFFSTKKPLTVAEIHEALGDDVCTKQRVRDHVRRLHTDEILTLDAKGRYAKAAGGKKEEE